jgi:uncharacterized protein YutE (UPF0331/DUF86 family)
MHPEQDSYYWLFSSSSQTVSALAAFLVTGFAIVLNMMDTTLQRDESLEEIHDRLKSDYYKKIRVLSITSGTAIILSLFMIYLNPYETIIFKSVMFYTTAVFNIVSIGMCIFFTIMIINPDRYKDAVQRILAEGKEEYKETGEKVDKADFMTEFYELEKKVRKVVKEKQVALIPENGPRSSVSFRQLVSTLFENEVISREELYEFLQINKFKNLVVHGHLSKVDQSMVERTRRLHHVLDNLLVEKENKIL